MESFILTIISILVSSYFMSMFFIDYKEHRYFLASMELASAITIITFSVCCAWNFVSNIIA